MVNTEFTIIILPVNVLLFLNISVFLNILKIFHEFVIISFQNVKNYAWWCTHISMMYRTTALFKGFLFVFIFVANHVPILSLLQCNNNYVLPTIHEEKQRGPWSIAHSITKAKFPGQRFIYF